TKLIILYSKLGDTVSARKVFDRMPERTVVSWSAQISGYSQNGCYQDALLVFLDMLRAGFKANQFTYGSVLRACTGLRCLQRGMQIQGCLEKSRFASNLIVQSALLDLHSKCGKMEDACYLFGMMEERDVVSWNAIIGGYAVQGFSGMNPDLFTFGSVLKASGMASDVIRVRQIHQLIIQLGYGSHISLSGSLIDAYAKCESLASAHCLYKSMPMKDMISCTALMTGYARDSNYSSKALDLFKEIQQMHMKIDDVILCSMFNICANISSLSVGRQIHALALKCEGWECFNNMISKYNILPRAEHFSCMVDLFARGGLLEEAYNLIYKMNIKPNASLWGAILGACYIYGNMPLAEEAAIHLFKMDPENSVNYVVLADIYAAAGSWDNAWKMRKLMEERNLKKAPGYSFIPYIPQSS
ncbi:hypothetical protein D5086_014997, partial [Populus alba]